ncbi:Hypothetical predicted protein [Mytilus galloprovincialis]|uniref:Uncharacterized protein n=1 Tax=Mytilus galloprovincialis TaxID=29158 RepID=A0A8B6E0T5_MYTGA|nr:Hypothetical predicted protein [Mytilus galloprovincialis]
MPPTTTDGIASVSQSPKTNDVPSTYGSATITEHHLSVSTVFPVTSTVSSPSNLKTTETPDFTTTSELTPCAPSCTKAYTCHCPTIPNTPAGSNTLAQLTLDKKTLSSYKRRHQSASDPRKSSVYIGCVGITEETACTTMRQPGSGVSPQRG